MKNENKTNGNSNKNQCNFPSSEYLKESRQKSLMYGEEKVRTRESNEFPEFDFIKDDEINRYSKSLNVQNNVKTDIFTKASKEYNFFYEYFLILNLKFF